MDRKQLDIFRAAFKQANYGNLSLPNEIDISKIYDIETYPNGMRDGYSARFRFTKDDSNNYQLELVGGDDYSTWHKHIDHTGTIATLDTYEVPLTIYPEDPDRTEREHREIQDHNDRLQKLLRAKGLERSFDDEEFEKNNVIVIREYAYRKPDVRKSFFSAIVEWFKNR